jgi:hypothetical protein
VRTAPASIPHQIITTHHSPARGGADPVNGWHQHVDALFVCSAPTGQIGRLDHHEATGARWTGLDEMQKLKVPGELPAITKAAISWAAMHGDRASSS